jgi:hypothetical protein
MRHFNQTQPTTLRVLASFVAVVMLAAGMTGNAKAVVIDATDPLNIPGLSAGQSFQLVFVSSTRTARDPLDGTVDGIDSTTIADWNNYVNTVASTSTLAGISSLTWSAIVSVSDGTTTVHARDNALVSAPVYRTDGALFASGFDDMWDGSAIPVAILYDESGALINTAGGSGTGRLAWTGSTSAGFVRQGDNGFPIGFGTADTAHTGTTGTTASPNLTTQWIANTAAERRGVTSDFPNPARVYGLSEVITIRAEELPAAPAVPEPGTATLVGLTGLVMLIRGRRRRGR